MPRSFDGPMSSNLLTAIAVLVSGSVSLWGTLAGHTLLWIPYSGLAASLLDLWGRSGKSGEITETHALREFLRSGLVLAGLYSAVALVACVALALLWLVGDHS